MKPGDLVRVKRFGEVIFIGIYLGPSRKFDEGKQPYQGRFVLNTGIRDIDLGNKLVWEFEVISETG